MIMTPSGIEPTTPKLEAHHLKCKAIPVKAQTTLRLSIRVVQTMW